MTLLLTALLAGCLAALWTVWRRQRALQRDAWIRGFEFPQGLFVPLRERHPQLSLRDCQLVAQALRQFFLAHLHSGRGYVSMPSQVADELWHEFILHTRHYEVFCRKAFGRFFHHTPAVALGHGGARMSNAGLRRCFWHVCHDENIDPRWPSRLPLLFAIDAKLNIVGGYRYVADCSGLRRQGDTTVHCGGDFAGGGFEGGSEGFGPGDDGGSADATGGGGGDSAGSDGSGCGGGGCGGGGGGD